MRTQVHCVQMFSASTYSLNPPRSLHPHVHCIQMLCTSTCSLSPHVHCVHMFTVFTCSLHPHIHCVHIFVVYVHMFTMSTCSLLPHVRCIHMFKWKVPISKAEHTSLALHPSLFPWQSCVSPTPNLNRCMEKNMAATIPKEVGGGRR